MWQGSHAILGKILTSPMVEIDEEEILSALCVTTNADMDNFEGIAEGLYARMIGWSD